MQSWPGSIALIASARGLMLHCPLRRYQLYRDEELLGVLQD